MKQKRQITWAGAMTLNNHAHHAAIVDGGPLPWHVKFIAPLVHFYYLGIIAACITTIIWMWS